MGGDVTGGILVDLFGGGTGDTSHTAAPGCEAVGSRRGGGAIDASSSMPIRSIVGSSGRFLFLKPL
jgi:hypothetical protein